MTAPRTRMRRVVGRAVAVGLLGVALMTQPLVASAASADVRFQDSSQSVRYGTDWGTQIELSDVPCGFCTSSSVIGFSYTGPQKGSGTVPTYMPGLSSTVATAYLGSYALNQGATILPVGKYVFTIQYQYAGPPIPGSNTYTLTISSAPIGTDLRVVSDPANPHNAVVSAMLTGDYVTSIGGESGGPPLPAGTWHLNVQSADKKTAFTQDVTQSASGPTFISRYWTGVGDGPYTATAAFTMVPESAGNFTVSNAEDIKFAPVAPTSGASPTPSGSPRPAVAIESSGPPMWTLGAAGVLLIVILAGAIFASVRLRRKVAGRSSELETAAQAAADETLASSSSGSARG
jgi:hypothetical protein